MNESTDKPANNYLHKEILEKLLSKIDEICCLNISNDPSIAALKNKCIENIKKFLKKNNLSVITETVEDLFFLNNFKKCIKEISTEEKNYVISKHDLSNLINELDELLPTIKTERTEAFTTDELNRLMSGAQYCKRSDFKIAAIH